MPGGGAPSRWSARSRERQRAEARTNDLDGVAPGVKSTPGPPPPKRGPAGPGLRLTFGPDPQGANGARGERHPDAANQPPAGLASPGRSRGAVSAPVSSSAERSDADGSHLAPHSSGAALRWNVWLNRRSANVGVSPARKCWVHLNC